jgi:hypothetical protein
MSVERKKEFLKASQVQRDLFRRGIGTDSGDRQAPIPFNPRGERIGPILAYLS